MYLNSVTLQPGRLADLRDLARYPLHQAVEPRQLRVDDRLARVDEADGDRPLRIGPAHDVDQPEVPEGEVGVTPVEAHHFRPEHQAIGEAGWEDEREVDLEMGLLGERTTDRPLLHHPNPVHLSPVPEDLEEAGELVRRRDDIRGRD